MEDPEPLEKVARGVPTAFAVIVRKLMAKEPKDRYQTGQELQADLAHWTDPARVKAILGAEAEAARAFRPPPPELEEDDLRLLDEEGPSTLHVALRDLGDAEPAFAPRRRPAPPPRPAVVLDEPPPPPRVAGTGEDSRWLIGFIVIVCTIGLLGTLLLKFIL